MKIVQGNCVEMWDTTIIQQECKNLSDLEKILIEYVEIIREMLKEQK